MGTKKTDGLLPPVTEDDTIFLAIICIILRDESSVLVLAHRGGFLFMHSRYVRNSDTQILICVSSLFCNVLVEIA